VQKRPFYCRVVDRPVLYGYYLFKKPLYLKRSQGGNGVMNVQRSKWWLVTFITVPVLYFTAQLLPFYHSGGAVLPSLGSLFWFPEVNTQATEFIALFHYYFRVNDLTFALLGTQIIAVFFLIMVLIKKNTGGVAFAFGCWGLFGLYSFLTTPPLVFSPVMVYGGIASILMLVLFLAAVVTSALYLTTVYKEYRRNVLIANEAV